MPSEGRWRRAAVGDVARGYSGMVWSRDFREYYPLARKANEREFFDRTPPCTSPEAAAVEVFAACVRLGRRDDAEPERVVLYESPTRRGVHQVDDWRACRVEGGGATLIEEGTDNPEIFGKNPDGSWDYERQEL